MKFREQILLGTFLESMEVDTPVLRDIVENFSVSTVFVFDTTEDAGCLITFNIPKDENDHRVKGFKEKYKNTVMLHRNKETNTLFTINSLNKIIFNQCGSRNPSHKVDWSDYKSSVVLLGGDKQAKQIKIDLREIIDLM